MAVNVAFPNPSFTQAIKITEMRAIVNEKSGKIHYERGASKIVQRKGNTGPNGVDDIVNFWLESGKVKFEIEALPS